MSKAFTIPYQLRPHKAIERNLFISLLKQLDRNPGIDIKGYRYVGFGAPFLEDFKVMHLEFGITKMHCIELNKFAYSRQKFNNPYSFVKLYNTSSTSYVTGSDFKQDKKQIIWWDFTSPGEFRQQLMDIEYTAERLSDLDILKLTFNASPSSFTSSHGKGSSGDASKILSLLKEDSTYEKYLPENVSAKDILNDFSTVIRAMAIRAVKRGLSNPDLSYNHIASFRYADGQAMTTLTGIITSKENFKDIIKTCGISRWEFYEPAPIDSEFIKANEIMVPAMTVKERLEIDKKIPSKDIDKLAKRVGFNYGETEGEHLKFLRGYCKYYKYLPYYSKVTF